MNTTAINIRTDLYNHAADYARKNNTSIDSLVESYIIDLMTFMSQDDMAEDISDSPGTESKGMMARKAWQEHPISEETKRLLPKRRVKMPDDLKALLEQKLSEKYESVS